MNIATKNSGLAKSIMLFTVVALLFNSTFQIIPQTNQGLMQRAGGAIATTFRTTLPGLISRTQESVKKGLSSVYSKVKNLDTSLLISKLLTNLEKLGSQLIEIQECMISGKECSKSKRAAFYATAIIVLALTAAVVGFTITVAATSKEPDVELNKAIEVTSQEVKGWSPTAVFQRLSNRIATFKQSLLGMKQCLTTRRCTKQQKRALYATAATIVALVTIAIGVGVGASMYAKGKKKEAITPSPTEGERALISFEEGAYPEGPVSPFQRFFRNTVQISQAGLQYLQQMYQQIKEQVVEGAIRTKEAAAEKFIALIEQGKSFTALIQEVLSINLQKVKDAFAATKEKLNTLVTSIKEAKALTFGRQSFTGQTLDLIKYLKEIIDTVHIIKPLEPPPGYSPLKRLARIKGQKLSYLEKMLQVRTDEWKKGRIPKEQVQEIADDIRIKNFIRLSNLNSIYPTLVEKINGLNLKQVGHAARKVTRGLKALIDAALWIHQEAGKIGILISQKNAQGSLKALGRKIEQLGENIQVATNVDKVIQTEKVTTPDLAGALVDAASSKSFQFLRKNWQVTRASIEKLLTIDRIADEITLALRHFSRDLRAIGASAKKEFLDTLKANPLRGIPHAATILRLALEHSVETARNSFKTLIDRSLTLLTTAQEMAPNLYAMLYALNGYMKHVSVHNNELINSQFLHGLQKIVTDLNETTNTAETLSKNLEIISTTPAA